MKIDEIGFYTLSEERINRSSAGFQLAELKGQAYSPMVRGEILITDKCNFQCSYCRGMRSDCTGHINSDDVTATLDHWLSRGLQNIRISGGEPLMNYDQLVEIVTRSKACGVKNIAVSTNGSIPWDKYQTLIDYGVNDLSISLDACCAADAEQMAQVPDFWNTLVSNIRKASNLIYVTVGIVITPDNLEKVCDTIKFAHDLGVADIRIITAAQNDGLALSLESLPQEIVDAHPILRYRLANLAKGKNMRGLSDSDSGMCSLVYDDSCVAGKYFFPCVIYLREGGDPIGKVGDGTNMGMDRTLWSLWRNSHEDPICKNNCLDVCIEHNNRVAALNGE